MKTRPISPAATLARRGFTLIELLVVISIIALLVAGAFGAYGFVMERARRADAQATAMAVYNAVDQYHTDYGYLPSPTSATKGEDCDNSDTSAPEGLIMILMGTDETKNPKKTNFLGDIRQAQMKATKQVNGIVEDNETLALMDPWGSYYKVRIDLGYDDKVENPNSEETTGGTKFIRKTAIVWSPGKDMDEKTWKDNITTWGDASGSSSR